MEESWGRDQSPLGSNIVGHSETSERRSIRYSSVTVPVRSQGLAVVESLSRVWLFCDPTDCSPPGSFIHGISQARILEWIAISFSRTPSPPRDRNCISCIGRITTEPHVKSGYSFLLIKWKPPPSMGWGEQWSLRYTHMLWKCASNQAPLTKHVLQPTGRSSTLGQRERRPRTELWCVWLGVGWGEVCSL